MVNNLDFPGRTCVYSIQTTNLFKKCCGHNFFRSHPHLASFKIKLIQMINFS
jgi:hypothetical protein